MKLNSLVAKPQLIKCELNDDETIKEYGESVEWYVYDRQPLDKFLKMATSETTNANQIIETMRDMILDEEGKPLLEGDSTLPTPILLRVLNKMTDVLGK